MTERKGDWMQTFTGKAFYPMDPRVEDIDIRDIAHALALQCRFGGHCDRFYSVAEHSVLVSYCVPDEHALTALMHDATEAYCVDVPRPLKRFLGNYAQIEQGLWVVIAARYGMPAEMPPEIKQADNAVLLAEQIALMKKPPKPWTDNDVEMAPVFVQGLDPVKAERGFLARFKDLTG